MHFRLSRILAIVITVVAGVGSAGCRPANYNGIWQGQTSQGKVISFTITDNAITRAKLECKLECQISGFCPTESSFDGDVNAKLDGNTFSASVSTATFTGKLESDTAASGEMKMVTSNPQCGECKASVTWTAKKL